MAFVIHLLHIFFAALAVYFGIAMVASLAVLLAAVFVGYKLAKRAKRFLATLAVILFVTVPCSRTVYASSVHVSHKNYAKEANKILKQYNEELVLYVATDHPGVTVTALNLYEQRAAVDLKIAQDGLFLFKRGYATQSYMDSVINQLSRDLEDTPPTMASTADLKN